MNKIKILTLNINTGHGPYGGFREDIERHHLLNILDCIAELIRDTECDVACLQEVDIKWLKTHKINQAEYIRQKSGLPYLFYHAHHKSPIPDKIRDFVKTSFSTVFNRDTGTAIISRHPFRSSHFYDFGQTFSKNPFINYWAGLLNESKGYTFVEIAPEGKRVGIFCIHLLNDIIYEILHTFGKQVRGEIFTRAWQVEKLIEHINEFITQRKIPLVVAGDFNTVPREAELHFKNSHKGDPDDYRRDISMYMLRESGVIRTIPKLFGKGTPVQIKKYYTYPALDPDRTLDYVFITNELEFVKYEALRQAVSDHLPVLAEISLENA